MFPWCRSSLLRRLRPRLSSMVQARVAGRNPHAVSYSTNEPDIIVVNEHIALSSPDEPSKWASQSHSRQSTRASRAFTGRKRLAIVREAVRLEELHREHEQQRQSLVRMSNVTVREVGIHFCADIASSRYTRDESDGRGSQKAGGSDRHSSLIEQDLSQVENVPLRAPRHGAALPLRPPSHAREARHRAGARGGISRTIARSRASCTIWAS